jgi:uncharacterized protein (TIGR02453 family)
VTRFTGFSSRAVAFYAELESDNTKAFWERHKQVYETEVRAPLEALLAELEPEFGEAKVFRPYRDVRFSKDKSPYKTHQGALVGTDGVGWYVHLDSDGLLVGGGFRAHSPADVAAFRMAVDEETSGDALGRIVATLGRQGFAIEGERLKTTPRGYPAEHPRIDLLRHKSLMVFRSFGTPRWLSTPAAADRVRDAWGELRPLNDWVREHVARRPS